MSEQNVQDLVNKIVLWQAQMHQAIGAIADQTRATDVEHPDVRKLPGTSRGFIVSSRALAGQSWDMFRLDFAAQKTALAEMISKVNTAPGTTGKALQRILSAGEDPRGRQYHPLLLEAVRPILVEVVMLSEAIHNSRAGMVASGFAP